MDKTLLVKENPVIFFIFPKAVAAEHKVLLRMNLVLKAVFTLSIHGGWGSLGRTGESRGC